MCAVIPVVHLIVVNYDKYSLINAPSCLPIQPCVAGFSADFE